MAINKIFNTQDLVLKVNTKSYDPQKLPIAEWSMYLDILCGNREYQKEAIKTAIHYLAGNNYNTINDLVKANYYKNENLQLKYNTEKEYLSKLQLSNKLAGSIDLATGTGKSFVMFGIAQIALGIGLVDKVLVLGPPSLTIERELTNKFRDLATNTTLQTSVPESAKFKIPSIINANQTIKSGCICIENINAVYSKTGSSIFDSLSFGKGATTLILNDEVHHAYNIVEGRTEDAQSLKKWKEFLLDTTFNFKYILGFTGTAYIKDDYFNDVIYRYSLRQAIENKFVKNVNYVIEDENSTEDVKFQKIFQNHKRNKLLYPNLKPLTILVTRDIKAAKQLKTRFVEFLVEKKEGTEDFISNQKVIIVTSDKEHKAGVLKLPLVDNIDEPAEWIISVSMLTEGWDVKNVFQIVPMEERAFDSKLLIAQVLGRGLRIPANYPNSEVVIFNHDSWSKNIKNLVEEILEISIKIKNSPLTQGARSKYHFELYNINYKKIATEKEAPITTVFNYKDYISFSSEDLNVTTETKYVRIGDKEYPIKYQIEKERTPIKEIVEKVYNDFQMRKLEGIILKLNDTEYTNENLPTKELIENMIRKSMKNVGLENVDYLGKSNRQAVYNTFSTLLRKKPKTVTLEKSVNELFKIETKNRDHETITALSLRNDTTIFFTDDYENEIVIPDTLISFEECKIDGSLRRDAFADTVNSFNFKTPIDLIFATRDPERKFIKLLLSDENAKHIDCWIKSTNQGFYSLEYIMSSKAGRHSVSHQFNPDFFILQKKDGVEYITVIETKSDGDDSDENKQKNKYATEHFNDLNETLKSNNINQKYFFHFLSPNNYNDFFTYLRDGRLIQGLYRSELDKQLIDE